MKVLLITLFKFNLKFVYFFLKLFPVNNKKIILLSRQFNEPSIDFEYIKEEFLKRDSNFKVVVLTKKMEKGLKGLLKYYLHLYKQMYHLATTKICIVDTYIIPVSVLKHKKSLKIYQIWHAMGTVKKFGYQTLDKTGGKDKKLSLLMNMHKGYTNIICGSDAIKQSLSKAFNYEEDKIISNDLPRIDYLIKEKQKLKKQIYNTYPKLKNKKNILYVPTFRTYKNTKVMELVKNIDHTKYNFILKTHPVEEIDLPNKEKYEYDKFTSLQLLTIADYVITDYSTISVESTVLNIPLYFYTYDYDKYIEENGLNIDIKEEFPNSVFSQAKDLVMSIENNNYDFKSLKNFKNKYIFSGKGNGTQKMVDFILKNR